MNFKKIYYQAKDKLITYKIVSVLNPVFNLFIGGDKRPIFFDIDQVYPALRLLEQHYAEIRAELDQVLPMQHRMPRYHDIDDDLLYASGRYNRDKHWNVFMLYCYGEKPKFNREQCPRTCELLAAIPYLCQGFFSILDPGKSIPRHTSPSRYYLRYHLGMKVPEQNPPFILLTDKKYTWKEGEAVLFDDSWDHEIINHASQLRAVLIVDVLRPMAWPAHLLGRLVMLLARWIYAVETHRRASNFVWKVD
ncbi:peptide-aspartate beta-dioxygenase [Janthinobacterium sp. ROICE36]|uniref:aspartyl/asparaginyl beta-hydroxylase domain-containing protein n=1 Tax=Janthinobacterium sp. ROICE36 TaxID=2048670 RepID=UPI000C7EFCA6|nr:aspartyl/asparaginyl beta-hydroxylase domain-containing protein [Janthinobacterium sp. ROICE36]PLY42152.1 peptide-aspartate beta-dioxygenase [Janthinobacterium sp. ROICE36]